jgi:hypothetical protein
VKQAQTQVVKAALLASMGVVSREDIRMHADAWKVAAKENAEVGIDIAPKPSSSKGEAGSDGSRAGAEQKKEESSKKKKAKAQGPGGNREAVKGKDKSEL